jgi:hypothetical protein
MIFSVIGQPVPLLLAPQEDRSMSPVLIRNANIKIFFIFNGLDDFTSKLDLQIYKSFCLDYKCYKFTIWA